MKSPATKCTITQKATCTATSACIRRRRECGSSPPLRALTGLTEEARSAGARPNRKVTMRASESAKPSTRRSAGSARRAGVSGELIMPRMNGADHQANNASRRRWRAGPATRFRSVPVAPAASGRRRWRRGAPSREPAPPPARSSGWRRWRTRSAAPAPPGCRAQSASVDNRAACWNVRRQRVPGAVSP